MNKMKLLGLLGFLGLLGVWTKNYGFFGFFGFFSFFAASAKQDERLKMNAYRAGFNGFIVALLGLSVLITGLSMNTPMALFSLIIAAAFIATIVTFVVSLIVLERKGS